MFTMKGFKSKPKKKKNTFENEVRSKLFTIVIRSRIKNESRLISNRSGPPDTATAAFSSSVYLHKLRILNY